MHQIIPNVNIYKNKFDIHFHLLINILIQINTIYNTHMVLIIISGSSYDVYSGFAAEKVINFKPICLTLCKYYVSRMRAPLYIKVIFIIICCVIYVRE